MYKFTYTIALSPALSSGHVRALVYIQIGQTAPYKAAVIEGTLRLVRQLVRALQPTLRLRATAVKGEWVMTGPSR